MKKKKKDKKNKKHNKFFTAFWAVVCICFFTVVAIAAFVLVNVFMKVNGDVIVDLNDYTKNQNQTSFIYTYEDDDPSRVKELLRLHAEENRIWVDLDKISVYLQDCFVGLEDKRFYLHHGVDWIRTIGSAKYKFSQGGSTITQQLIKNITNEKDVTVVRKFNEIVSALNLEKNYDKKPILEAYLNTVYLGSGCYGVKTAAEKYFGKDVSELNLAESACIAVITKAPYGYNPLYNRDANRERQLYCLRSMLEQGLISQQEYDDAVNYHLVFTTDDDFVPSAEYLAQQEKEEKEEKDEYWSYYIDFVIQSVIDDLMDQYDYSELQASNKIYYGGLKIYAAVDLDIQADLEYIFENRIGFDNNEIQGAMTVMNYTGRVMGIVGGAGKKTTNRGLNIASSAYRQPGSTIKPISTYAPLFDLNEITWSTKVKDYAFAYNGSMWPHNVDKTLGSGANVTIQYAVQESKNTVPARLIKDTLTIDKSYDYLENHFMLSHLDSLHDKDLGPLATGSLTYGASTLEMCAAYATFGNGGKYYKPYSYYKVTNSSGTETILDNTNPQFTQAISEEASDIMCEILQTVNTSWYGSAPSVRQFPIFAKTGTTSDEKDRWFCAGTPYYVGAVWYGYSQNPRPINASINPAGTIFFNVFDRIHRGLDTNVAFPKSANVTEAYYCTYSGNLASSRCYSTAKGWYSKDNMPDYCMSSHSGQKTNNNSDNSGNNNQSGFSISDLLPF
ncbi:MAG: penicillin-binding protein [Clostridia bacterium]|nr:penicillin-binding protein [Clostridia bacterium]